MNETSPRSAARWIRSDRRCRINTVSKQSLAEWGVLYAGIDHLRGHFLAGTPCSTTHLLWFVVEGKIQARNERFSQIVEPGQFVIAPAGTAHWLSLKSKNAIGVWFHLEDVAQWQALQSRDMQVRQSDEILTIQFLMERLIQEQASERTFAAIIIPSYRSLIGTTLRRQLATVISSPETSHSLAMETLRARISSQPAEPWSVSRLARELHVSASHFYKLSRQYWRAQPMEMVTQLRLHRAQDFLVHTALTLEQIAERVGYQNAYAFSNVFRKHLGVRPGAFRRQSATTGISHEDGASRV